MRGSNIQGWMADPVCASEGYEISRTTVMQNPESAQPDWSNTWVVAHGRCYSTISLICAACFVYRAKPKILLPSVWPGRSTIPL
jgi:hypothetical protein